jgi:hypothetical protein
MVSRQAESSQIAVVDMGANMLDPATVFMPNIRQTKDHRFVRRFNAVPSEHQMLLLTIFYYFCIFYAARLRLLCTQLTINSEKIKKNESYAI